MSRLAGSRSPTDVALPVMDFPDQLSPVFVRDLRRGLRAQFFVWCLVILQSVAFLAAVFVWAMTEWFGVQGAGGPFTGGFIALTSLIFGFVLPVSLFNALQAELGKSRNVELLLTSRLSSWQIVCGKFSVATALSGLLLVSLLPYYLILYFLGGIELMGLLISILSLLVSNAVMNAIVIGASAFAGAFGRVLVIFFLMISYGIIMSADVFLSVVARTMYLRSSMDFGYKILVAILFILLSLQLGRSKLKLCENPLDPPATTLIFLFIVLAVLIQGIVSGLGGGITNFITLAAMITLAFFIDRSPRFKKQLKAVPA